MIRFRYVLLSVFITVMGSAWGASITENQAREIATSFMATHSMPSASLKMAHRAPLMSAAMPTAKAAYYVFNTQQTNRGFVIVAGDDRVPPILGYSDSGTFDAADVPEAMQEWLDGYALQIKAISEGAPAESRDVQRSAIEPMLPVRWGQGMPYSVLLPHINGSENAHAYVGCVAVAMAQVMAYWQYPPRPTKTIPGYTSNSGKTYAVTMPSLSPMDFDWENMQDTYYTNDSTSVESQAVSNLMLYSTTAMKSNFGLTSTGSYTRNIPGVLISYFGYKNSAHYIYRENFSTQAWEDTIYAELAAGRPVAYGGNKQSAGHAYVCDGYDGEGRFHINWGWAGKSNGYFLLNLLNPSAEGIGSAAGAYGYVKGQGAAIGVEPADGTSGTASLSFKDLKINSTNTARSGASSNFSVTVSGQFINNTNVSSQFRQGWGLYNQAGELIDVLYIRYTTSALSNGEYITVSSRPLNFGAGITSGTYRILPIYSIYPSEEYRPCVGSDVNYIEVTFGGTYSCTIKGYGTAGSTTKYTVNSCNVEGTLNHGKPVTLTLNLNNAGTSTNDLVYMFVDGTFNAMGLANIAAGESGDLVYRFTPTTAGTKTVTFSLNESGSSPFYTQRVTIKTMPSATLDVSYRILNITDEENRIITADSYSIIADITNTGTTTYNEDFSARLYRVNNPETNVGTELLNMTKPLYLEPGESTSLQFDFDHDLIDGWKYFCYLYYYSNGSTESKGTRWYYLNLLSAPEDAYRITTMTVPVHGGAITLAGGNRVNGGDTVAFTVTPNTGYQLASVNVTTATGDAVEVDETDGIYTFIMPESDVTISATFDEIPVYAINAGAVPAAGGRVSVSDEEAAAGQTVTVAPSANVGWQCSGISATSNGVPIDVTAGTDGSYNFVMPESDVDIVANFSRSTGSLFELVTSRDLITEGGTYVIASQYYDKAMKFHEQGETTFGTTPVVEWMDAEKSVVRIGDNTCMIEMKAVNPDTIRYGATSGARTNAFLSTGNGYLTTSNGNVIVSENCTNQCRAGMFVSTNAYNYLVRFFNEASGASSDYMTVRYDYDGDQFRILNYSDDNQQRVWLYKLVPSWDVVTACNPVDGGIITLTDAIVNGQAQTGETVTFSVTAAEGYAPDNVSVTDANNEPVEVTPVDDEGIFSFTMPASNVLITANFSQQQPEFILGDVNDDGVVDIDDITMLIGVVLGSTPSNAHIEQAGNVDGLGAIDIDDITALISQVLGN